MKYLLALTVLLALASLASLSCGQQNNPTQADQPVTKPKPHYSKSGYDLTPLSKEQIAQIVKTLTPEQVQVTQNAGTEAPNCGVLLHEKRPGIFVSVVGGLPLFRSNAKFESGTGWPSFLQPIDPDHLVLHEDSSHGMTRVEVLDARSGAHLGHVFNDGPAPTGKRFCMNSAALKFIPDGDPLPPESQPVAMQTAYFAGGCFWGVEDVFAQIPGVIDAQSGYMGGKTKNPTYKQVCYDDTGHAETVKVTFDPNRVSYEHLLKIFFANHDPTTLNRQGPDVGDSYRSAIFAATPDQKSASEKYLKELQATPRFADRKIVTQIIDPGQTYWPAEDYHQDYHQKHGGFCKVSLP